MRTTIDFDADIEPRLRQISKLRGQSLRSVVNELLRVALNEKTPKTGKKAFVVEAHAAGFLPGIDQLKLNQLNDELEIEDFVQAHLPRGSAK